MADSPQGMRAIHLHIPYICMNIFHLYARFCEGQRVQIFRVSESRKSISVYIILAVATRLKFKKGGLVIRLSVSLGLLLITVQIFMRV